MSNFICSECGMTNIDCGYDGYKTPKEIELEKKVHILNEANMKLENELGRFAEASKTIERLREQLDEAIKTKKDQELIIKKLKRRRICDNQKTEARKEHINELIEQVKKLKEEIARRGRLINELKTQRKEANEIISVYRCYDDTKYGKATEYCKKWDVK